jgi:hypothetical protein
MAKKKETKKKETDHGVKIVPKIIGSIEGVDYESLEHGECFLYRDTLWMKEANQDGKTFDQTAINLATGRYEDCFCGKHVIPVNVTINWERRK